MTAYEKFNEIKTTYLSALKIITTSEHTYVKYESVLNDFTACLEQHYAEQTADEITPEMILTYQKAIRERGVSINTTIQYLTVLHAFFAWCVAHKFYTEQPIDETDIPEPEEIRYDLLNMDEINQLLTQDAPSRLDSRMQARNQAIVVLLTLSGMRNGELRALRLKDLDFDDGTITITRGKGNKSRSVPFPPKARELVKLYLESGIRPKTATQNDYLFGTDADKKGHSTNGAIWKPFSSQGLCRLVHCYTKNSCNHSVKTHTLRHAAASNWDDKDISMRDIQRNLGHSSITTTEHIYVTILNNKKAALKVNDALANV